MTRDEVLEKLTAARAVFDEKLEAVPAEALERPLPGSAHSVKDIVAHVSSYDDLVVQRLIESRAGRTTAFDRDRAGWEAFNERVWREVADVPAADALALAREVFAALVEEVARLTDEELGAPVAATAALDPAWLSGHAPWELIETDTFDHYTQHYAALDAARTA